MRAWDFPKQTIVVRCETCGREGRYTKAQFLALVGEHARLAEALSRITAGCPRRTKGGAGASAEPARPCQAHFPALSGGQQLQHDPPDHQHGRVPGRKTRRPETPPDQGTRHA